MVNSVLNFVMFDVHLKLMGILQLMKTMSNVNTSGLTLLKIFPLRDRGDGSNGRMHD